MVNDTIPVRLVEWNVAMSLQNKTQLLAELKPTIAILPESAHPDRTGRALEAIGATSMQWIGNNPNKGLLAAAFGDWTLRIDDTYDPGYQWVMPLHLCGPRQIRLLAVWDMNHRGKGHEAARRLGACRASMEHYKGFLSGGSDLTIISGDFNNSVYWDKPTKSTKFADFMDEMESHGFRSAYHSHHGCARGAEPHPTLWWMKNVNTTYHIDYTFVSHPDAVEAVTMGGYEAWIAHSDHNPMTVDMQVSGVAQSAPDSVARPILIDRQAGHHQTAKRPPRDTLNASPKKGIQMNATHAMRFPVEPGSLPDMICGVNGEKFTQEFHPTHFTADWKNGVLVQVRVWGPRVLGDGSLGKRLLDHRWHDVRGSGPVKYSDLPPVVATRLRSYNDENGLKFQAD